MVFSDAVGNVFEEEGLPGLGLCDDESALSFAYRREEVYKTGAVRMLPFGDDVELFFGEE